MRRFAPSHPIVEQPAGLSTLAAEREGLAREKRCSWALVILLSLATVTVALSTNVASSQTETPAITAK